MTNQDTKGKSKVPKIVVGVIFGLLFFLLAVWVLLACLRDNPSWRRMVFNNLDWLSVHKLMATHIPDAGKDPRHWRYFVHQGVVLPFVYIAPEDGTAASATATSYTVTCHGASHENEYYYEDYLKIANQQKTIVISLEYPGFGERKIINKERINEDALLARYAQEVKALVEDHLRLPWEQITLVGQCFGSPIAISIAALPDISDRLKHLYLTKPMPGMYQVVKDSSTILAMMIPPFFEMDEYEDRIVRVKTKVTLVHVELDTVCLHKRSLQLFDKLINAKEKKFLILKGATHGCSMSDIFKQFPLN